MSSSEEQQEEPPAKRPRTSSFDDMETHGVRHIVDPVFQLKYGEDNEEVDYADWKIVVESTEESNRIQRKFSVHVKVLAAKAEYFKALSTGDFAEGNQRVSSFEFPGFVVKHFETMLDYCYERNYIWRLEPAVWGASYAATLSLKKLTATQISALLYLSDYFQMKVLSAACKEFLKNWRHKQYENVINTGMLEYYQCCKETDNCFLRDFIIDWICDLDAGSDISLVAHELNRQALFVKFDPNFLVQVLNHEKCKRAKRPSSLHGMDHVTATLLWERRLELYYKENSAALDVSAFLRVTSADILPQIKSLNTVEEVSEQLSKYAVDDFASNEQHGLLKNLRRRCTDCLKQIFLVSPMKSFDDRKAKKSFCSFFMPLLHDSLREELGMADYDQPGMDLEELTTSTRDMLIKLKINGCDFLEELTGCRTASSILLVDIGDDGLVQEALSVTGRYNRYSTTEWVRCADDDNPGIIWKLVQEDEESWKLIVCLEVDESRYTTCYTNDGRSEHSGFPPFEGWRNTSWNNDPPRPQIRFEL